MNETQTTVDIDNTRGEEHFADARHELNYRLGAQLITVIDGDDPGWSTQQMAAKCECGRWVTIPESD